MESGMDDLVVHGEHEHVVKISLHGFFQFWHGLAVDMPGTTGGRCVSLALQGGHADDAHPMRRQRRKGIFEENVFILGHDMLQHIQRKHPVVSTRNRPGKQIVRKHRELPALDHARLDVLDKHRIKVCGTERPDFLLHDTSAKSVTTTDFQNMLATGQHFCDEFVARKPEQQMFGIIVPALAAAQAQSFESAHRNGIDAFLVLWFARLGPIASTVRDRTHIHFIHCRISHGFQRFGYSSGFPDCFFNDSMRKNAGLADNQPGAPKDRHVKMSDSQKVSCDAMLPKVKFLTAIWGETYIKRFATLALPSFIAPGNLPALATATDLEVVIMTRHADIIFFETQPAFRKLHAICPVRFVEIDDLVTTAVYGVTLTLAYARAIIDCGNEMLRTHFVLMNADFVLADGSLRSLCRHIEAGHSIVLGPSFRATAEDVEPQLEAAIDMATHTLVMPPRQMVALSLPHPHPTTIAKTLTQEFCHSTHPNQFFWQVDAQTLLGRYYLIFPLCLRPERIVKNINCFCDYAFLPEMCPSGDEVAMTDSDDFFMLELQARNQEMHMLRLGRQLEQEIIRSLQKWTTVEHRRAARYDIVFHTGDIPTELSTAKTEAHSFIGRITDKLGTPVQHARHPYWIRGMVAWQNYRKEQGVSAPPPELAFPQETAISRGFWFLIYTLYRLTLGKMQMSLLHPYWLDYRMLRNIIREIRAAPNPNILVIRDNTDAINAPRILITRERPGLIDRLFGANAPTHYATTRQAMNGILPIPPQKSTGYTHAFIHLLRKDCRNAQEIVAQCRPLMATGSTFCIFVHHFLGEIEKTNFSYEELLFYATDIIGTPPKRALCSFVGGRLKQRNAKFWIKLSSHYASYGAWSLLWITPLLLIGLPLSVAMNIFMSSKTSSNARIDYCSSMAIHFDKS